MRTQFLRMLEKYGQTVGIYRNKSDVGTPAKAFIQAMYESRGEWQQALPSPLGLQRRDRFLYLGPPDISLEAMEDGWIVWQGKRLRVAAAQAVYAGNEISHWWATLRLEDEEVQEA